MHLVGYLCYCINDGQLHKHQSWFSSLNTSRSHPQQLSPLTTIPSNSTEPSAGHNISGIQNLPRNAKSCAKGYISLYFMELEIQYHVQNSLPSRGTVYQATFSRTNFLILKPILNAILPHRTTSSKCSVSLRVSEYSCTCFSYKPRLFYLPRPSQRHVFQHTKNIWKCKPQCYSLLLHVIFRINRYNFFPLNQNILVITFS